MEAHQQQVILWVQVTGRLFKDKTEVNKMRPLRYNPEFAAALISFPHAGSKTGTFPHGKEKLGMLAPHWRHLFCLVKKRKKRKENTNGRLVHAAAQLPHRLVSVTVFRVTSALLIANCQKNQTDLVLDDLHYSSGVMQVRPILVVNTFRFQKQQVAAWISISCWALNPKPISHSRSYSYRKVSWLFAGTDVASFH